MTVLFLSASSLANDRALRPLAARLAEPSADARVMVAVDETTTMAPVAAMLDGPATVLGKEALLARNGAGAFDPESTKACCRDLLVPGRSVSIVACTIEDAAILSVCLEADLEVFTGSGGAFQCDPGVMPDAEEISSLSFEEAVELSRFPASGLDPDIVGPLARYRAPALLRPLGDGPSAGTRVSGTSESPHGPVKAIARQNGVSMVSISGTCLPGMVGMAARVFATVSRAGVSVLLITQSSSEYSICFCIRAEDEAAARNGIAAEFAAEIEARMLDPISVIGGLSILTLIGDGMRRIKGIAGKCFTQLARADVNIVALAQGSSERSISAVVPGDRVDRGIRMVYQAFFDSSMPIDIVLVGCGNVGSALLAQLATQSARLEGHGVGLRLVAVSNSRRMVVDRNGLDPASWKREMERSGRPLSIPELTALGPELSNPVLVDCSASEAIPGVYPAFMMGGFHVVTPNKRGNSGSMERYLALKRLAIRHRRRYLYETTVGAGLPVIENLQNLLHAGDSLESFSGILSGSLSFLFGRLEEGAAFSAAVREAMARGFTEPDPRDDLSGTDVARKVLILAREAGLSMELGDIELSGLIPGNYLALHKDEFVARMHELDAGFESRRAEAAAAGKVLRFIGSIESGKGRVGLQAVGPEHPLFAVKGGENALAFSTRYYSPVPLLLRGYGAGAEVTAAGVFADILRTLNWIREA